ncbi:MAG: 8-amino-7-oxononanoate synthase [Bacteroidetes bacterium]|nr:8-amino-7-oxononanoate synthase [Fibrella sp.]
MPTPDDFLRKRLDDQRAAGLLRRLTVPTDLVDFCSNDYLGLSRSADLRTAIDTALTARPDLGNGATGSRLLAGNSALAVSVEEQIARFYRAETALIFNSGYDVNVGLLASLPRRDDTLITDELIHASMIDGARLSYATRHRFRHNDLNDLERKLKQAQGQIFVAVESVYSMDGDLAPLSEMADLCDRYGAALIVDEAHATGVFGPMGAGLVCGLGLEDRVLARIHTFGKSLGVHGAAVVGPPVLRDYLINFARPFVYTTALPPHSLLAISAAHAYLETHAQPQTDLHERVHYFRQQTAQKWPDYPWPGEWLASPSPIQGLIVPGNDNTRRVADTIQQAGFDVRAILSPTVPVGRERLRICLHSFNAVSDIDGLLSTLQTALLLHYEHGND